MEKAPDGLPELDFIRDEGSLDDRRPRDPSGWDVIVFELEDEEQPVVAAP
ncbi:MAG: hypothetical protein WA208_05780 [Thermoanaerobaculia bacterium]